MTRNKEPVAPDKRAKIDAEIDRITKLLSDVDAKSKKIVDSLIRNAAFMAVTLDELQETMNENGVVSEYQNGENQWGTKKSPEVEIYNTMIKNHSTIMKQLTDLRPKAPPKSKDDGFEGFVNGRERT
ncbi:hypothetical protein QYF50_18755 [Paenibacillus vini]|uniref:hypothetical protein n=1 Tax=Paenibacillus vini TaxID=1476024 RepID=UPI0025B644EF|nr:hypothetical protein [Paenibacillus vini]MDN4069946.1 hypothetical protein [Paenibacillus vini]